MTIEKVGLIGIGLLGGSLAERLLQGGSEVCGFDLDESRRTWLAEVGGHSLASTEEVFAGCDLVLLSLPTSAIVREVLSAAREMLRAGQVIVDTTTGDPEDAVAVNAELVQREVDYVECNVVGSSEQARHGEAICLLGGCLSAVSRVQPFVDLLTNTAFHVGDVGTASRMKLAINLALGMHRAALAEALALAGAAGLDESLTLQVLKASPAYSRVMDTKGEKMLTGDFTPQARLAQHRKDVELMLQLGERCGQTLPLTSVHRELLDRAISLGYGDDDNSAIRRAFD
ncbi:MAG: NAD(P)-dependent oxidoreductase [Planctomycetales bacterium]|nr:NAD(P)-dependent oxidoreductase [Planctomycetales bacterium]